MANSGSVLISRELRIHNGHRYSHSYSNVMRKNRTHIVTINLTSHGLNFLFDPQKQNPLTLQIFRRVPSSASVSSKYNIFLCQSVLVPVGGSGPSILKSATLVLSRSYDAFYGSLLIIKLIPAIGLIAFAAWGLRPLIHLSRNLFLHTTDSNWNRSNVYYVTTSYIQPLLLWIGATLVCSALDPLVLPSEPSQAIKQRLLNFVRSLSTVLAFAYCLSSLIQHAQKFFVETNDSSEARNMGFDFAGKAVYTAVWVAALSLFMELLGFSTQKWLTAGGLGTVLLTLAGREIFTNFLSSVMIHATRPFVLNEWIQTKIEGYEVSGTVEHVGWWSPTIIRGDDREAVHIPNHKFTVNVVRNLSQKTHWRIKSYLAISHFDVNKINNIVADMRKVIAKNPQVEQQRLHRRVFLDYIDPENQALMVLVSCFVKTSHFEEYLCVKEAILLDLLRVISHHRARLATPIRTVQKIYREGDLEDVTLADAIFSRSTAANDRPLLLIEPLYKINSDDKKSSTRSMRSDAEKDSKQEAASTSNMNASDKAGLVSNLDGKTDDRSAAKSNSHSSQSFKSSQASKLDSQTQNSQLDNSEERIPEIPEMPVVKNGVRGKEDEKMEYKSNSTTPIGVTLENPLVLPESDSEQIDKPSVGFRTMHDGEASSASPGMSMPPLEENILLGVALEGSKRTLPIEEEMSSPTTLESREMSAHLTPLSQISEAKDSQIPTVPNVTE